MSKECKIYYGTVVNTEGSDWGGLGSHEEEPIRVEGRDPFGKPPEFCCEEFKKAWRNLLSFYSDSGRGQLGIRLYDRIQDVKVCFCPFCGAKIILLEDLKLRVVKTTRTAVAYYLEKA